MTCKISFVKSIKETLKHHLAVLLAACIVFFIQLIVFFLNIQSIASYENLETKYLYERITQSTLPSASYVIPVVLIGVILGYDLFRSLHSKKQTDFYESLPLRRKDTFMIRIAAALVIFFIPYVICTVLEMLLLATYGFTKITFFTNLLWNALCMILIFLTVFFTAVLAMIMTGHTVVAAFGFGVFSAYAPILLRYLHANYANEYFHTYVDEAGLFDYLEYLSPFGLTYRLLNSNYAEWTPSAHVQDFIAIVLMILVALVLSFFFFLRRPAEVAGRAMAFEQFNPFIRIALIIPLTLYVGLFLSMVAATAPTAWMIFGFVIGCIILHGIIESIFQFDIRGVFSHKRQLVFCFLACFLFAAIYQFDLFGYDNYLPKLEDVKSISMQTNESYNYNNDSTNDIGDENIENALLLAERLIKQNFSYGNEEAFTGSQEYDKRHVECIRYTYHLKNGFTKKRVYYMVFEENEVLFNTLYTTKEFKDNLCQLYTKDWNTVLNIEWNDYVGTEPLLMSKEKLTTLFETYLAEYTPMTYSDAISSNRIGYIRVNYKTENSSDGFDCYVYPQFKQTIALLEQFMSTQEDTQNYGSLTETPLYKYPIVSLEIYGDKEAITIQDKEQIELLAKEAVLIPEKQMAFGDYFDWNNYYDASLCFSVDNGLRHMQILIPKEMIDSLQLE